MQYIKYIPRRSLCNGVCSIASRSIVDEQAWGGRGLGANQIPIKMHRG